MHACVCNMYVFSTKRNSNLDSKNKKLWWKNLTVLCGGGKLSTSTEASGIFSGRLFWEAAFSPHIVPSIGGAGHWLQVQCWWFLWQSITCTNPIDIGQPRLWLSAPIRAWRFLSPRYSATPFHSYAEFLWWLIFFSFQIKWSDGQFQRFRDGAWWITICVLFFSPLSFIFSGYSLFCLILVHIVGLSIFVF